MQKPKRGGGAGEVAQPLKDSSQPKLLKKKAQC